ncbi:MAG: hypothetical protein ACKO6B_04035 [Planctomycetia bacterium]
MNTFRIYEDFRESLGEPAARALAQTLGAMFEELQKSVTKEDFRVLQGDVSRDTSRLDTALAELAEAQKRTEQRLDALIAAQQKTELELYLLIKVAKRQSTRLDTVLGRSLELQFRDRMTSYLWRFLKRGRLVSLAEFADRVEPALDEEALEELSQADAIATGLVADRETFIIAEVSSKADVNDVRRAVRWAGLLQRAGLPAIPLVACDVISDRTLRFADQQGVRIFKQGRLLVNPAA